MTRNLILLLGSSIVLLYLFRTFRFHKRCPKCGNPHPDRVRRPSLMKLVPSKAYRCTACGKRFYRVGSARESSILLSV